MSKVTIQPGDALLVIDLQNDFLPGGALAVPRSDEILPVVRRYLARFLAVPAPVFATRDWHPRDHCSFRPFGGPWPVHCVAGTKGADAPESLAIPSSVVIVHKATRRSPDAYSGFQDTRLDTQLRAVGARRLFVGGLATDYCVLQTVRDAFSRGYSVVLLRDACRAVDLAAGDGRAAEEAMIQLGVTPIQLEDLSP